MFNFREKKIVVIGTLMLWVFSLCLNPLVKHSEAAIGDIGHWRDSIGGQIPGLTFAGFNFDQSIRNDGIYSKPNNSTIQLSEAGTYLVSATIRGVDNSNGRYTAQARMALTSGTGSLFTTYFTGFSRDNSENTAWFRVVGVVVNASANAQVQIQRRRDTDAPTSGSIAGQSDVQVVRINPTNYGIYAIGATSNAYGGTTPNLVNITAVTTESNTAAIQGNTTTETVTIKGDNKKYLVAWSISGDSGGQRTQRIGHLEYSGVDNLGTRSYCYQRNAANEYCGIGSVDIISTGTPDIPIRSEVFRGPGVAADQGGADDNGSWVTDGNGQMIVLELPDSLEVFRSRDSTGLQDVTATSPVTLNAIRTVDFNNAASFTQSSNTAMSVTNPADIWASGNIFTARNNITSGSRLSAYAAITVGGVAQTTGEHGNYTRGNQASTDTFGGSFHPAGIFTTASAGQLIGLNMYKLAGTEGGGTDRTQANSTSFFAMNLDTLVPPAFEQSAYRWFTNTDSADVGAPLAALNTSATLSSIGQKFRLRALLHISNEQLRLSSQNFKLQFAPKVGTCDTAFVGEVYTDVTTTSLIAYNDNATPANSINLVANANDPTHSGHTINNQSYKELNNFTNIVSAIPKGQDAKWDFSLKDNGAPSNTSYCFRIRKSDDTNIDTYSVIPEITTATIVISTADFVFDTTTEGWSFVSDNGICNGAYIGGTGNSPGSLQTTGSKSGGGQTCNTYWEWSGSWEDLGVPVGHSVIGISGDYEYAVSNDSSNGSYTTGGLELLDSSSVLRETLVTNLAGQSGTIGFTQRTGAPAVFSEEPSTTQVRLRLRTNVTFGGGNRTWTGQNDNINILITSTNPSGGTQTLTFSISDNTIGFGSLSSGSSRYATGDTLGSASDTTAHSLLASSNASSGYTISLQGETLKSGTNAITAIGGTALASSVGSKQFGLRATVLSGTGSVSPPFNTANWAFTENTKQNIISGIGDDTVSTYNIHYLANITGITAAGSYQTALTYTITATF